MTGKLLAPRVTAVQRPLMHYLRAGDWVFISKLPIPVGQGTIDRIVANGCGERRGDGYGLELKLTPEGLAALQRPV